MPRSKNRRKDGKSLTQAQRRARIARNELIGSGPVAASSSPSSFGPPPGFVASSNFPRSGRKVNQPRPLRAKEPVTTTPPGPVTSTTASPGQTTRAKAIAENSGKSGRRLSRGGKIVLAGAGVAGVGAAGYGGYRYMQHRNRQRTALSDPFAKAFPLDPGDASNVRIIQSIVPTGRHVGHANDLVVVRHRRKGGSRTSLERYRSTGVVLRGNRKKPTE